MDITADANEIRHSISSLKRRRRFRIVSFSLLTALLLLVFVSMFFFLTWGQGMAPPSPIPEPLPTEIPADISTGNPAPTPRPSSTAGPPDLPTAMPTPSPMPSAEPTAALPPEAADPPPPSTGGGILSPEMILIFSGIGSLLSALATASNVILSWRKDRREVEEFRRKLIELEMTQARSGGGAG